MTGPVIDPRDAAAFVAALHERLPGFVPQWRPGGTGADAALHEALARYLAAIATRLNRVPERHQSALLDLLGVELTTARPARAPVVFTLAPGAADSRVPVGTRLVAASGDAQVLFEVERTTGLTGARLAEVRSLWPGRDQSIDHMPAITAGQPFQPWRPADLQDQPHHLYLAHSSLLALTGQSHVAVDLELSQGSSEPLDTVWEYWDGVVWRPFANSISACDREAAAQQDSTDRLRHTGAIHLLTDAAQTAPLEIDGTVNLWIRGRLTEPLLPDPAALLPEIEQIRLSTIVTRPVSTTTGVSDGFLPDFAIVDGAEADVTKPFYPFGQQPQPGSAFYLSSADAFEKPGANLQIAYVRTATPQDELAAGGTTLSHEVAWEYWRGDAWVTMPGTTRDPATSPADLDPPAGSPIGTILLTVPDDMEPLTVAGRQARWLRARLVSGGFGFTSTVSWTDTAASPIAHNTFSYVVARPPAVSVLKLGYTWTSGPAVPERVLAYNDFRHTDRTTEAVWPGQVFRPFTPPADTTPALYLGFDRPLPVDDLGVFVDVVEDPADTRGPAQIWEFFDGGAWRRLPAGDETNRLRLPGLVHLTGPRQSRALDRFGTPLHWLRVRLAEDGPPGSPTIRAIHPNAARVIQQETVTDQPLGTGTGVPEQTLAFPRIPVLPGETVEVREFAGPRAATEWRVVAHELFPGDQRAITDLETLLGREGVADVERPPLRLRRDRAKRVTEVWVTWQYRAGLVNSGPGDRHYLLERSSGRLTFGDGVHGRIPAPGAAVTARRYRTGGGGAGNVTAGTITQLQAAIGGVQSVTNPVPAEGGADTETLTAFNARGPATLRHRDRGLSANDLAALAREASPAVARAWVRPTRAAGGRRGPGRLTVVIIPAGADPRPWPSFGLRESVREYLTRRAGATTAALRRIDVTGPEYQGVDVDATLVARRGGAAGELEDAAAAALGGLLHPLHGGPDGDGWPPGRPVFLSDVATVLATLPGLDHVEDLAISVAGRTGGEAVAVPPGHVVAEGTLRLAVTEEPW
ncbi:hypothetical protein GCM10010112_12810 [Actinoplanes lobatus]|uniref:Baseplate protein J-like domain-containing protein n=1 Tax=Actinoplanes lobatus TaxID=113568 RepID=A0A7W7HMB3_9ACTN|nr:putative baseplate assembly protein [Actinoplanes lobatus]MBB4753119.1 hypothetical protein [Actinoplanes lobatus]GGN58768.1 hypothetical protein GCM10010112_12810 [Actinoplanes lobatus]GIE43021.1 hypothetical protein Alo02nite_59190 [Actinoplanes lobatus]